MNLKKLIVCISSLILSSALTSCEYFVKSEERKVIVRVNDSYLFEEDINALITEDTSPEDSAVIVSNYITRWATQQLLIDRAKYNLPENQQREFNDLVENYRNELYTNAYKEAVVAKQLDTSISEQEIEEYYINHKENFKLNEDLVKLRYIRLDKDNINFDDIKAQFKRFNEEDKESLETSALQFKNYSFQDSIWVSTRSVYEKIVPLGAGDRDRLLNKSTFMQLEDSLEVYLIYVKEALSRNEQAPLDYASPIIKQILLNKRKLNLVKELEKDITKDAIKNEQFEIHN